MPDSISDVTAAPIERIYTDGACSGNPGPGGWGTVIYFKDGGIQELGGGDRATTNNRMEMQAAIDGLRYYAKSGQDTPIVLYTDSEYVKNGITKWISGWKKKGWKTSTGKAVLNQDLWEELDELNSNQVEWRYVKGHSGNEGNERCDEIARSYAHNNPIALKQYKPGNLATVAKPTVAEQEAPMPDPPPVVKVTPEIISESNPELEEMQMLRDTIDRLRFADEICQNHYLVTTQELAILLNLSPKTLSSRKEDWVWRNWLVSRVREESHQTLWQLERVEEL